MRLAVFASGGGSNLGAILDASADGSLDIDVVLVISNKAEAGALERAKNKGIASAIVDPNAFNGETAYLEQIRVLFDKQQVNFVALAGYLRKIPEPLVRAAHGRMLNIHPALLPSFGGPGMYGRHIHEAVLEYGARWSGATIHLVDIDYDTGPIVLQHPVPVLPEDTPASLAARILDVEHQLYPEALRLFAEHRVTLSGRQVHVKNYTTFPETH